MHVDHFVHQLSTIGVSCGALPESSCDLSCSLQAEFAEDFDAIGCARNGKPVCFTGAITHNTIAIDC